MWTVQAGADEFVLAPVDTTAVDDVVRGRVRRRRRLVVDDAIIIRSEVIKHNMTHVHDIVHKSVVMAPPTKQLMTYKEFDSVDKIFSLPGHRLASSQLLQVCTPRPQICFYRFSVCIEDGVKRFCIFA